MSKKMKVLWLPLPKESMSRAWGKDVMKAVGESHDLSVFDKEQPVPNNSRVLTSLLTMVVLLELTRWQMPLKGKCDCGKSWGQG